MKYISNSLTETLNIARSLGESLNPGDVVAFLGGMGMGKTTFTHGVIAGLGGEDVVSSPTFAIMNEYETPKCSVYHFDMYRIETYDDLYSTGFFDLLSSDAILIIEWSENIENVLEDNTIYVSIELGENDNSRVINIDRR